MLGVLFLGLLALSLGRQVERLQTERNTQLTRILGSVSNQRAPSPRPYLVSSIDSESASLSAILADDVGQNEEFVNAVVIRPLCSALVFTRGLDRPSLVNHQLIVVVVLQPGGQQLAQRR